MFVFVMSTAPSMWARLFMVTNDVRVVLRYNFVRTLSIDRGLEEITFALGDDCPHTYVAQRISKRKFHSGGRCEDKDITNIFYCRKRY